MYNLYYLSEFYTEGSVKNLTMFLFTLRHFQQARQPFGVAHHQSIDAAKRENKAQKKEQLPHQGFRSKKNGEF